MQKDPQEFEKLRKLIALKRHEAPPPGYFEGFSDKVIQQIEADATASPSIWQQAVSLFRTQPALSWSLSAAAVALLFVASSSLQNPGASNLDSAGASGSGSPAAASMVFATNTQESADVIMARGPVMSPETNASVKLPSLFSTPFYEQATPVSYSVSGVR